MATETAGVLVYDLTADQKNLDKGIDQAEGKLSKSGSEGASKFSAGFSAGMKSFSTNFVNQATAMGNVLIKTAAVSAAAFGTAAVKSFADYEQLIGGVETLFKDSADTIERYSKEAYKTAGLSANQYMTTITSFSASLLQGLGGDTKKAAEIGNMAVKDMADNANKMGTDIGMIQIAYQGFAKQNYTMLDNLKLGYGGSAGEMARLINKSGVLGKSMKATAENVKDIPFDKLIQAIHTVQNEMGITGTTAKEAAGTISGSFNAAKSAALNALTALGTGNDEFLRQSLKGLAESTHDFLTNVGAVVPKIISGIGEAIDLAIGKLPPEMQAKFKAIKENGEKAFQILFGVIEKVTVFLQDNPKIAEFLGYTALIMPGLAVGVAALAAAFGLLTSPLFLVAAAIAAVVVWWPELKAFYENNSTWINALIGLLGVLAGKLAIGAAVSLFKAGMATVAAVANSTWLAIMANPWAITIAVGIAGVAAVLNEINKLKGALDDLEASKQRGRELDNKILEEAKKAKAAGDDAKYKRLMQIYSTPDPAGPDYNWFQKTILGMRANGGDVMRGGSYIVGEKGPELFTPKSTGTIASNEETASLFGNSGGSITINVGSVNDASTIREIVKAVEAALYKQQRRSAFGLA